VVPPESFLAYELTVLVLATVGHPLGIARQLGDRFTVIPGGLVIVGCFGKFQHFANSPHSKGAFLHHPDGYFSFGGRT